MTETEAKLTESANEITLAKLLEDKVIWSIPFFQRPYQWKTSTLEQFQEDLHLLIQNEEKVHFLGVIIFHDRPGHIPGFARIHDLIDGQQRLTTVFLHLAAVVQALYLRARDSSQQKEIDEAKKRAEQITRNFLIAADPPADLSNFRLHSAGEDMQGMNEVFKDAVSENDEYKKWTELPTGSISTSKTVIKNYKQIKQWVSTVAGRDIVKLNDLLSCLLTKMTIVSMKIKDPHDGPRIFSRLNAKQHQMSSGDLIRNEVFNKLDVKSADSYNRLNENHWKPFYDDFRIPDKKDHRSVFEKYFFPIGLMAKNSLKKSEVFDYFVRFWARKKPEDIIQDLKKYQSVYLAVSQGHVMGELKTAIDKLDKSRKEKVIAAIGRLVLMNSPASSLPYLMQVFYHKVQKSTDPAGVDAALELLKCFETFLTRRAVCGYEPTGLHALFKVMYSDHVDFSSAEFWGLIEARKTITIVSDDEFEEKIQKRELYDARITQFILSEWNVSEGGDMINDPPEKEHILPQTIKGTDWSRIWTEDDHKKNYHRLANLLPVSAPMNKSISNAKLAVKLDAYKKDSKYKITREFGDKTTSWKLADLNNRAKELAIWAKNRWPFKGSTP